MTTRRPILSLVTKVPNITTLDELHDERVKLDHILESDNPDVFQSDPLWPRVLNYWDAERLLLGTHSYNKTRLGVDDAVSHTTIVQGKGLGRLTTTTQDTITIHTREAFYLFTGRKADATTHSHTIIGGLRCANALKAIWHQSKNNNPYADWLLIAADNYIDSLKNTMTRQVQSWEGVLAKLQRRGFSVTPLQCPNPAILPMEFGSPYGYAIADLITDFDNYNLLLKTMVQKGRIADEHGSGYLRRMRSPLRALFKTFVEYAAILKRPEFNQLTRADWEPDAPIAAAERRRYAIDKMGPVPDDILVGATRPKFTRKPLALTSPGDDSHLIQPPFHDPGHAPQAPETTTEYLPANYLPTTPDFSGLDPNLADRLE